MRENETRWQRIYRHNMFLPLLCLGLVMVLNLIRTPSFLDITINNGVFYGYIIDILNRSAELVILSIGMTIVVASSGGVDISVGSVAAVSGAVCLFFLGGGEQSAYEYVIPYMAGFALSVVAGSACGAFNGFLVAKLKIQPMVATLILFTAGRGIAQLITSGQIMYMRVESYKWLAGFYPGLPLPTSILLAAAMVAITAVVLRFTALGIYIQSVGINRRSSRLVGLNSNFIIFLCYTFCGLCSGVVGMVASSRVYSLDANNLGNLIEMDAILAVALGGNSLAGGKFSLAGSVIGAVTIQALTTSLLAMKVSADQLSVYKAVVVVIIVALQSPELMRMLTGARNRMFPRKDGVSI